ncbi:MAG TPA: hypothetical protein VF230_07945, partial [Acidimicrobiales bacterium]
VDHRGRVLARSTLGEPEVLSAEVPRREGSTIYARLGDWPVVLSSFALLAWPWVQRRVRVRGSAA